MNLKAKFTREELAGLIRNCKVEYPASEEVRLWGLLKDNEGVFDVWVLKRILGDRMFGLRLVDLMMLYLNELLGFHGVEYIPEIGGGFRFMYLNAGDTYNTTFICDSARNTLEISTYGDIVEKYETMRARRRA